MVPLTAKHESSMLQDLRAGKRTEIDAFNGAIVKLGQHYRLEAPTNVIVSQIIKFLERQQKEEHANHEAPSAYTRV